MNNKSNNEWKKDQKPSTLNLGGHIGQKPILKRKGRKENIKVFTFAYSAKIWNFSLFGWNLQIQNRIRHFVLTRSKSFKRAVLTKLTTMASLAKMMNQNWQLWKQSFYNPHSNKGFLSYCPWRKSIYISWWLNWAGTCTNKNTVMHQGQTYKEFARSLIILKINEFQEIWQRSKAGTTMRKQIVTRASHHELTEPYISKIKIKSCYSSYI